MSETKHISGQALSIPLGPRRHATLMAPADLGLRDLQILRDYLDFYERALTDARPDIQLGPAFWAGKAFNVPIVITGYLGFERGRHYVAVDGSDAGIPLDEVVYAGGLAVGPEGAPE